MDVELDGAGDVEVGGDGDGDEVGLEGDGDADEVGLEGDGGADGVVVGFAFCVSLVSIRTCGKTM